MIGAGVGETGAAAARRRKKIGGNRRAARGEAVEGEIFLRQRHGERILVDEFERRGVARAAQR